MRVQSVTRRPEAFQRSVSAEQITAMSERAFGRQARVVSAVELGYGMYNNTYRVELSGQAPVILRVAPEPGQQNRIERHLMRNEHASLPYFAPIAHMMPRTLAVDFTHEGDRSRLPGPDDAARCARARRPGRLPAAAVGGLLPSGGLDRPPDPLGARPSVRPCRRAGFRQRPGTERDSFWESYGELSPTPEAALRRLFYLARHIGANRLERHRLGRFDDVPGTYDDMRPVLEELHA